jgi:hypothetical protein
MPHSTPTLPDTGTGAWQNAKSTRILSNAGSWLCLVALLFYRCFAGYDSGFIFWLDPDPIPQSLFHISTKLSTIFSPTLLKRSLVNPAIQNLQTALIVMMVHWIKQMHPWSVNFEKPFKKVKNGFIGRETPALGGIQMRWTSSKLTWKVRCPK